MFKENDECCAIQCEKCGGTMYSGAASARFVNSKDKVRSLQLPASSKLPRFAEITLRTPPMIVRYVKPKFLHEVIPPEKGFKKSIFQMLKFW